MTDTLTSFLPLLAPYDALPEPVMKTVLDRLEHVKVSKGGQVYEQGETLKGLYIIASGQVLVRDAAGHDLSLLEPQNSFAERGLLRDGNAVTSARAEVDSDLLCLPRDLFHKLRAEHEPFRRFFDRGGPARTPGETRKSDLGRMRADQLMSRSAVTCPPDATVQDVARLLDKQAISCVCVCDESGLLGIATLRDLSGRALAQGLPHDTPVAQVMTRDPMVLAPSAIGSDVLNMMVEHRLGHLPVVLQGRLLGIVTKTDLTRAQASGTSTLVQETTEADSAEALARVTQRIPTLLVQLVAAGNRHDIVTRMITDIADVVTRRLLALAEEKFGPPPCRYAWAACGSQGRQEQTGVSDQDNCLIIEDGASQKDLDWFEPFARFVCDGLNTCGYVYCPGDMMATNPRWRQPLAVWRDYFDGWIKSPSREAQMLASVMFDLRVIGGDARLFEGLQEQTLAAASANSIFTAHMASNALTHQTPLGLLRGLVTIRSGDHRNTLDLKLNGVVPVVDLGRMYALEGRLDVVNTRARLRSAILAEIVSDSGGRDLVDAYDLVAQIRLEHQARLVKAGEAPDNFLPPATLSGFERSHLRDAFVVIKTMQSALMQNRGVLG